MGEKSLASGDEEKGEKTVTRRDSGSDLSEEDERLSDSTASPDRTPPFGPTEQEPPSPTGTVTSPPPRPLTPTSSFLFGGRDDSSDSASTVTSSTNNASIQSHRTDRPILRAYASARDLHMSKRDRSNSTVFSTLTPSSGSSSTPTSAPTSPRNRARGATIALSPRQATKHAPLIHSRSSSHPDFKALLAEYERSGTKATTRVWGAERSGRATPDDEGGNGGELKDQAPVASKGPVPNVYRRCSVDDRKRKKDDIDPSEAVEGIDVV